MHSSVKRRLIDQFLAKPGLSDTLQQWNVFLLRGQVVQISGHFCKGSFYNVDKILSHSYEKKISFHNSHWDLKKLRL